MIKEKIETMVHEWIQKRCIKKDVLQGSTNGGGEWLGRMTQVKEG